MKHWAASGDAREKNGAEKSPEPEEVEVCSKEQRKGQEKLK